MYAQPAERIIHHTLQGFGPVPFVPVGWGETDPEFRVAVFGEVGWGHEEDEPDVGLCGFGEEDGVEEGFVDLYEEGVRTFRMI